MKIKRFFLLLFQLAFLISVIVPMTTNAETQTVSSSIESGPLAISLSTPNLNFNPMTLNGEYQDAKIGIGTLSITDARGTGEGWHVTVQASRMKENGGANLELPSGAISLTGKYGIINPVGGTSSPIPKFSGSFGTTRVDIDNGSPVKFLTANSNEGMGGYDIDLNTESLQLLIKPSWKVIDKLNFPSTPTPYETILTWSIVNGP